MPRKLMKEMLSKENLKLKRITKVEKLREKGITLIALVVTVIILLILAGVTLNIALSENGLFSKAQNAADRYKEAKNNELSILGEIEKNLDENYHEEIIQKYTVVYHVDTDKKYEKNVSSGDDCLPKDGEIETIKDGYTFVGWREDSQAVEEVLETKEMKEEGIDLYAVFSKEVTLTYYNNTTEASTESKLAYYNNGTISNPTFTVTQDTKDGWNNRGWSTDGSKGNAEVTQDNINNLELSSDTTLYGLYQRTVTVSYDGNGHTSGSTTASTGIAYYNSNGQTTNASITLSGNGFTKTNYNFTNWAEGATNGTARNVGYTYTGTADKTYYALWSRISQPFTFTFRDFTWTLDYKNFDDLTLWASSDINVGIGGADADHYDQSTRVTGHSSWMSTKGNRYIIVTYTWIYGKDENHAEIVTNTGAEISIKKNNTYNSITYDLGEATSFYFKVDLARFPQSQTPCLQIASMRMQ